MEELKVEDPTNVETVSKAIRSCISAKIPNHDHFFAKLIATACINSLPDVALKFDIDNIRVVHIMGSSIEDSYYMSGMVVKRAVEGRIDRMTKPRIAIYSCPLDTQYAETKGTVLLNTAEQLLNYTKDEENLAEEFVQKLVNANINVVFCGASFSDIVLHFLDKYKIMAVRIMSKFELKRIARAIRAVILSKLSQLTEDDVGTADQVSV